MSVEDKWLVELFIGPIVWAKSVCGIGYRYCASFDLY